EPVAVRVSWVVGGRAPNRRRSPDCCRSVSWVGRLRGRLRLAEPVCDASLGLLGAVPRTGAGRPTAAALFLGSGDFGAGFALLNPSVTRLLGCWGPCPEQAPVARLLPLCVLRADFGAS